MRSLRFGSWLAALALACTPDTGGTSGATAGSTSIAGDDATTTSTTGDDPTSTSASADTSTTGASTQISTGSDAMEIECPSINLQKNYDTGEVTDYLHTQADVDQFVGCTHSKFSLSIHGSEIVDLTPLASLRTIEGSLDIYGASNSPLNPVGPASLAGLESLESVQSLRLEALQIPDLAPLAGLTAISGDVHVERNWALTTLEGLHNLTDVGGALVVHECKQVQDLNGLRGLQRVGVRIWFGNLPIFTLHGLENLKEVGTTGGESRVGLYALSSLTSLDALAVDWSGDHDIWIYGTKISDLGAFAGVVELKALNLGGNVALSSLSGLESLTIVHDALRLSGNKALTDLSALKSLEAVGALLIEDSPLTDLALPVLQDPGDVRLSGNNQLIALTSLAGLTTLRSLVLEFNPMLTGVPELAALTHVEGDLELRKNAGMIDLADLPVVTSVGGRLAVVYNPALLQSEAEKWASQIVVGGVLKIVGNKGYDQPPLDPCPWADDLECDDEICVMDGFDCLSD